MDGGYYRSGLRVADRDMAEGGPADDHQGKPVPSPRQPAARKKPISAASSNQAALWPGADTPLAYSLINRRRSLIRRLDHLQEDAMNEHFHEAAVVLRDALERLRLALLKDTQLP